MREASLRRCWGGAESWRCIADVPLPREALRCACATSGSWVRWGVAPLTGQPASRPRLGLRRLSALSDLTGLPGLRSLEPSTYTPRLKDGVHHPLVQRSQSGAFAPESNARTERTLCGRHLMQD